MNDSKDNSYWTMNETTPTFDEHELGMIPIDELKPSLQLQRKTAPKPMDIPFEEKFDHTEAGEWWTTKKKAKKPTPALDAWADNQVRKAGRGYAWMLVIIMLAVLVTMVSYGMANAGSAFMTFEVINISDDLITVRDENGDVFDFYKERSPEVSVGQKVIVCTYLTYNGDKGWTWDTHKTAIIEVQD